MQLYEYKSTNAVDNGVDVFALTDAPEIVLNVVVSSECTFDDEIRVGSGLT